MFLAPGLALKFNTLWFIVPQRQDHSDSDTNSQTLGQLFNLRKPQFPYLYKGAMTPSIFSGNVYYNWEQCAPIPGATIFLVISLVCRATVQPAVTTLFLLTW